MSKQTSTWRSERLGQEVLVARWGEVGTPVLVFPTAAGDAEECERFLMIRVLAPMLEQQRIKLYSVDSVAGQAWLDEARTPAEASSMQNRFDAFVVHELVPLIRQDCRDPQAEIVVAGASIGAFNALAAICRHPDIFSHAICMSGTYDLKKFMRGKMTRDYYESSPLHFLPDLSEGEQLRRLRERFVLLAHGDGRWEDPDQSWRAADALGKRGVPNRVDAWGKEWDHDWPTWRKMLPQYLGEFLPKRA
jgi:esterase/lipase superfamily enzyme